MGLTFGIHNAIIGVSKALREFAMAYPVIKLGKAKDYFEDELFLEPGEFGVLRYDEKCYLGCCVDDDSEYFLMFPEGRSAFYVANEKVVVLKKVCVGISVLSIDDE